MRASTGSFVCLRVVTVELGGDELLERRVGDDLHRQVVHRDAPVDEAGLAHVGDLFTERAADRRFNFRRTSRVVLRCYAASRAASAVRTLTM